MAKDMNIWTGTGRLGRDPEVRYFDNGDAKAEFSIAVTVSKKDGTKWVDDALWLSVEAHGKQAELAGQFLAKGSRVAVTGRLRLDTWKDKATGADRERMKVIANELVFLTPKGEGDSADPQKGSPAKPASRQEPKQTKAAAVDDDLPF